MTIVSVFLAGGLGSVLRWGVHKALVSFSLEFFWATLVVNILGSFLLGWCSVTVLARSDLSQSIQLAIGVGLLGGFTTFSTFSLEAVHLLTTQRWGQAIAYICLSLFLGIGFALLGIYLGQST